MAKTPRRRGKELAFGTVAVLLPLAGLGAIELASRQLGFGGYPPVIIEVGDDGGRRWYSTHRPGTDTFFDTRLSLTGGMREVHFTTPKPPNTIRIAILGGSAAQGFPQPLPLTNGSFLAGMVRDVWSGRQPVEVLNFGATAVASFPVKHFLDEVLDHDPDLVVVMCGNNEFYGAYGVSSLHSAGRSPTAMATVRWLRGSGLVQWLSSLRPRDPLPAGKLMELVAVEQRIGPEDSIRRDAERSLRAHLRAMVRQCRSRNVPVILCTVPTNERMAPIGEEDPDRGEPVAYSAHDRADSLVRLGEPEAARREYVLARDLDPMPWRATSRTRAAVLEAAGDGAILCDMEEAFRAASEDGVIGWDLMDDHVHLSVAGQALFARTVLRTMTSLGGALHVDELRIAELPDWSSYAGRLGRDVYTDYVAAVRIRRLFEIPFMRQNNRAAAERAERRCVELHESMSETDQRAVERWRDPGLHGATDRPLTYVAGVYRMLDGDHGPAQQLFLTARASVPTLSLWRLELVWLILTCRRHLHEEAGSEDFLLCREVIELGERLRRFDRTANPEVLRYLGLAYNLAGNHDAAIECLEVVAPTIQSAQGWEVIAALADSYVQVGRRPAAIRLLDRAARNPELSEVARMTLRSLEGPPSE